MEAIHSQSGIEIWNCSIISSGKQEETFIQYAEAENYLLKYVWEED